MNESNVVLNIFARMSNAVPVVKLATACFVSSLFLLNTH